jgi:hypothetical protein
VTALDKDSERDTDAAGDIVRGNDTVAVIALEDDTDAVSDGRMDLVAERSRVPVTTTDVVMDLVTLRRDRVAEFVADGVGSGGGVRVVDRVVDRDVVEVMATVLVSFSFERLRPIDDVLESFPAYDGVSTALAVIGALLVCSRGGVDVSGSLGVIGSLFVCASARVNVNGSLLVKAALAVRARLCVAVTLSRV